MPRDGSDVYNVPNGTYGIEDTTIESASYNAFVDDLAQDLNHPRPILAGGTAATNAADAMTNLGGEHAHQVVVNYDSDQILAGSFYSAASATSPPVASHAFAGFCYLTDANNMVIEARDQNDTAVPGRKYVREKKAGTWGPWKSDGRTVIGTSEGIGVDGGDMFFGVAGVAPNSAFVVNTKADASGVNLLQVWKDGATIVHTAPDVNLEFFYNGGTLTISALNDLQSGGIPITLTSTALTFNSGTTSFATSPTAPTPPVGDNSTTLTTTAWVTSFVASAAFLPIAGGTITGSLAINGALTVGSTLRVNNADIYTTRSDGTGVIFLGSNGYLFCNNSTYTLPSYTVTAGNGRLWGSNDFSSTPVSNGRLASAGVYNHTGGGLTEPFPGAVVVGLSLQNIGGAVLTAQYRYVQLFTTGWFTVGTA
jgi:hypothetical protein